MTDVLLINSLFIERVWTLFYPEIPLGLAYVGAVLEREGLSVAAIDLNVESERIAFVCRTVKSLNPSLIGISTTFGSLSNAFRIARTCKEISGARVVVGGIAPTLIPEEILARCPSVDAAVRGEGERAFRDLALGVPLETIPSLTYRKEGAVTSNPDGEKIDDLDSLPFPARHLFPLHRYGMAAKKNTTMMETSRGCPFACDFCVATVKDGRTFRKRSPGHMVLELEHIAERHPHIRFINIVDDNLLLDRARVEEFCRLVIEKKLNRRFRMGMSTRTQLLVGKDPRSDETRTFIDLLVEAGFRGVFLGVETSHGERMKQYGKVKDFEDLRYAIDMLERKKLRVLASYILGFPEETPEDVKRTIEISRTLNSSGIKYNLLTPYPGTVLGEKMRRDGLLITDDYTLFDNVHQVVRFPAHNDEMHRAEGASALNDDAHQGGAASVRLEGVLKKATTGYYNRLDYFRKAPTGANRRFRWSIFFSYHCHWHYLVRAITRLRRIGRRLFLHDRDELEI